MPPQSPTGSTGDLEVITPTSVEDSVARAAEYQYANPPTPTASPTRTFQPHVPIPIKSPVSQESLQELQAGEIWKGPFLKMDGHQVCKVTASVQTNPLHTNNNPQVASAGAASGCGTAAAAGGGDGFQISQSLLDLASTIEQVADAPSMTMLSVVRPDLTMQQMLPSSLIRFDRQAGDPEGHKLSAVCIDMLRRRVALLLRVDRVQGVARIEKNEEPPGRVLDHQTVTCAKDRASAQLHTNLKRQKSHVHSKNAHAATVQSAPRRDQLLLVVPLKVEGGIGLFGADVTFMPRGVRFVLPDAVLSTSGAHDDTSDNGRGKKGNDNNDDTVLGKRRGAAFNGTVGNGAGAGGAVHGL